jgi:hypothetical protein
VERLPVPARPVPRQTAFALRIMYVSLQLCVRNSLEFHHLQPRIRLAVIGKGARIALFISVSR